MDVPEFRGRGVAVAATALAAREDKHRFMQAFPERRQRAVERDLPQARLRAARGSLSLPDRS
jgi:hypothetical protein